MSITSGGGGGVTELLVAEGLVELRKMGLGAPYEQAWGQLL